MNIRVSRNDQEYGPYTMEELAQYVNEGSILPDDYAYDGMEWITVSQLLNDPQRILNRTQAVANVANIKNESNYSEVGSKKEVVDMGKTKIIRYVLCVLIMGGFFLPWLDLGEMGEMMSGLAAMAGGEMGSTFSGYQLASGGAGPVGDDPNPPLYAVLAFGLLVTFYDKTWATVVCSFLAIGIILLFCPMPNETGKDAGVNGWAIGKVLTVVGFTVMVLTRFFVFGGSADNTTNQLEDF